jgi:hypothetical protein
MLRYDGRLTPLSLRPHCKGFHGFPVPAVTVHESQIVGYQSQYGSKYLKPASGR